MHHPGRPSLFIGRGRPLAPSDESRQDQASRDSSVGTWRRPSHIRARCLNRIKPFHLELSMHLEPCLPMLFAWGMLLLQHHGKLRESWRGLFWHLLNRLYVHLEPGLPMLFARVMLLFDHQVKLRESWRGLLCL